MNSCAPVPISNTQPSAKKQNRSNVITSRTACDAVIRHLTKLRHRVTRPDSRHAQLVVDSQVVEVRVARWGMRWKQVKCLGKTYRYPYEMRSWNLHSHGTRCAAPDWWVLLTAGERTGAAFVVPGHELTGLTLCLVGAGAHVGSRVARYAGAWGQLRVAAREVA